LSAVVLAVLSWTPGQHMVRTGMLSGTDEHFLAHLLAATAVAAAVRRADLMLWTLLALVAYAGFLELGQYLVPGRDPALGDFAASALGAMMGVGTVWLCYRVLSRARRRTVMERLRP
jgi:VanZ family protein